MHGKRTAVGWLLASGVAALVACGCGEDDLLRGAEGNAGMAGAPGSAGDQSVASAGSGHSATAGRSDSAGSTGGTVTRDQTGKTGGAGAVGDGSGGIRGSDAHASGQAGVGGIKTATGSGGAPNTHATSQAGAGGLESDGPTGGAPPTGGTAPAAAGAAGAGISGGEGACAATTQGAHLTPINLVFIYDKSGSMGDDLSNEAEGFPRWLNMDLRWNPAKEAMTAFFENPGAPEIYASLKFFPANGDYETTCSLARYQSPDVPRTPLTEPDALISALERTTPGGGTPTLPALMGSIEYATALMVDSPGSKSVVIMVTDGEPVVVDSTGSERTDNCPEGNDNTIDNIAAAARAAYQRPGDASIPTYVIGIGEALDNLSAIAVAGGTNLILIEGASNEDTKVRLLMALQGILMESISCDLSIPVFEGGDRLDFAKVNVAFVQSDGTVERLYRDEACRGAGWRYDNASAPTKVTLCPATCAAVQTDLEGHLEVELGCDTRVLL